MTSVPQAYYDFVMDYAPYLYVTSGQGPDLEWGRAAFAAGFAVDFLFEAYFDPQFDAQGSEIEAKIVELTDWILTQQCTDTHKLACGGFRSTENSTQYHSADACRTIPALLKAYELTSNPTYLGAAVLAGNVFLYNMQHMPSQLGVHERYYGGFARAVTLDEAWLLDMDVQCLHGLLALRMLGVADPPNKDRYEQIGVDAAGFYRGGLEECYDHYSPKPTGDNDWHRTDAAESVVWDDSLAYALFGLYDYEGYSNSVQKAYMKLNSIGASRQYAAYNPAVCWAGYLNLTSKTPACNYYDAVTSGILATLRRGHDKSCYQHSLQVIKSHAQEFMFWGLSMQIIRRWRTRRLWRRFAGWGSCS
ncbi:MAG: hypothetical protein NWF04_06225 [Candidatus Bathyarchaeota archaeon]|nr:hypothetical protein [Candidatus Bathyarchaeota archaeon]